MPLRTLPADIMEFYRSARYCDGATVVERADRAFESMQRIRRIDDANAAETLLTDLVNIISSYFDTVSQYGQDIAAECGTDEWVSQTKYLMWKFLHTGMNRHDISNGTNIRLVVKDLPACVLPTLLTLFVCEKITGYHTAFLLDEIPSLLEQLHHHQKKDKKDLTQE